MHVAISTTSYCRLTAALFLGVLQVNGMNQAALNDFGHKTGKSQ
jgi:hypothetical protein